MDDEKATSMAERIRALRAMGFPELVAEYERAYGEKPRSKNREHIWRRVAWRWQADFEGGGLSERARTRLAEIASEVEEALAKRGAKLPPTKRGAEIANAKAARTETVPFPRVRREGLPLPGSVIERVYKGKVIRVKFLDRGVESHGVVFRSLSSLAAALGAGHVSGPQFFKVKPRTAAAKGRNAQ